MESRHSYEAPAGGQVRHLGSMPRLRLTLRVRLSRPCARAALAVALGSALLMSGCAVGKNVSSFQAGTQQSSTTQQGQAALTVNPSTITFGNVVVGNTASQAVTFTNSGTADLTVITAAASPPGVIGITGLTLPLTLSAGQSTTFYVSFSPTAAGNVTGNVSVASNSPNSPSTIAFTGMGLQGQLTVSPNPIGFGNVPVGTSATQSVTATNSGSANLTISQVNTSGAGVAVSGLTAPLTLSAGQSTVFQVTFSPASPGNITGSVSLVTNAPGSPTNISVTGSGVQGQLSVSPASMNFGNVTVSSSSSQSLTVNNTGTLAVTISQVGVTGTGFTVSGPSLPLNLAAGQSIQFTVTFTPSVAGNVTGNVSVTSTAAGSPASVPLTGAGVSATGLTANPSSLSFGGLLIGSSNSQNVTLTNTGTGTVTVSQANVNGAGFSTTGLTLPLSLTAGQVATFGVVFAPSSGGSTTGSLSLVSNASGSPTTISLSGSGMHWVALTWAASTSVVTGYNVYRSTVSGGPYTRVNSSGVAATNYTDSTIAAGQTYYYVTTAVDSNNVESTYSNEATVSVPLP